MAVKIRLARTGKRNAPYFRVVVADERRKRDGKCIETVGHYDIRAVPPKVVMKQDRVDYWLKNGATPTLAVKGILKRLAQAAASK